MQLRPLVAAANPVRQPAINSARGTGSHFLSKPLVHGQTELSRKVKFERSKVVASAVLFGAVLAAAWISLAVAAAQ